MLVPLLNRFVDGRIEAKIIAANDQALQELALSGYATLARLDGARGGSTKNDLELDLDERGFQRLGATLQRLALVFGHLRVENFDYAVPSEDTRQ